MKSLSHVRLFATPWTVAYQPCPPWDFPGKGTGVGCHFLLQRIFPTQGTNPGLLHCRQTLDPLSHQGSLMDLRVGPERKLSTKELMLLNCGVGRRFLKVPWIARRSNQSILKEIGPEYSLGRLMLRLKLQYFGHLMQTADSLEKILMLGKTESRRRRG